MEEHQQQQAVAAAVGAVPAQYLQWVQNGTTYYACCAPVLVPPVQLQEQVVQVQEHESQVQEHESQVQEHESQVQYHESQVQDPDPIIPVPLMNILQDVKKLNEQFSDPEIKSYLGNSSCDVVIKEIQDQLVQINKKVLSHTQRRSAEYQALHEPWRHNPLPRNRGTTESNRGVQNKSSRGGYNQSSRGGKNQSTRGGKNQSPRGGKNQLTTRGGGYNGTVMHIKTYVVKNQKY